jgi:hypothetical protein
VKGTVTCAPLAGETSGGAGGPLALVGVGVGGAGVAVGVGVDLVDVGVAVGDDVPAGVGVAVGVLVPCADTCCGSAIPKASRSKLITKMGASRVFFIANLLYASSTRGALLFGTEHVSLDSMCCGR